MLALGEIVRLLAEERSWTPSELARRIQAAGAPNVRYQHIQQLYLKPTTTPRYLPQLARVFGMSVEDLLTWTPSLGVRETQPADYSRRARTRAEVAADRQMDEMQTLFARASTEVRDTVLALLRQLVPPDGGDRSRPVAEEKTQADPSRIAPIRKSA